MCFRVLFGLEKFFIDFGISAGVIGPSEGWPSELAIVPVIGCMEESGKGVS